MPRLALHPLGIPRNEARWTANLCIWLYDYYLTHGAVVGYSGQNQKEVRKKETWLLAHLAGTCHYFEDISLYSNGLVIKLEFPKYAEADPGYVKNLGALINSLVQ